MLLLFKMELSSFFTYILFEFLILTLTKKLIKSNVLEAFGKSINEVPFTD
jgi:hypothetical protein